MKEGQKDIYYIASDSLAAAANAPFVEQLIKRDLEARLAFIACAYLACAAG